MSGNAWLAWQLVDSAFPGGSFAHSGGLEAAWQAGEIAGREGLAEYLRDAVRSAALAGVPVVRAAVEDVARVEELDSLVDAMLTNHVANRASRAQGVALLSGAERIYGAPALRQLRAGVRAKRWSGHFTVACGASFGVLGVDGRDAAEMFVFMALRQLISAAVRLNAIGPLDAQAMQYQLTESVRAIADEAADLPLEAVAATAPVVDVLQGMHDRLYSRLFQS